MKKNEQLAINAEYLMWRKNIPNIYDLLIQHVVDSPIISVQWLGEQDSYNYADNQQIFVTLRTSGRDTRCLQLMNFDIPDLSEMKTDDCLNEPVLTVNKKLFVEDSINRARLNSFSPNFVATRSDSKNVNIYDFGKHPTNSKISPDLILRGHESGGFGLDWSNVDNNILITCGEDKLVCLFDINKVDDSEKETGATKTYTNHTNVVNDVSFNKINSNVFASVGDDRQIIMQDIRNPKTTVFNGHTSDILSVEFNYFNEHIFCTGSADTTVKIWDSRKTDSPVYTLTYHSDSINQTRWSPHSKNVLGSCSADRKICIWDLNKIGEEESKIDQTPAELVFIHSGHKNNAIDIAWNPVQEMEIASISYDNVLQIWSMATNE